MPPFFSVIVPTYNRIGFIKTCIDSVLNQTFRDFELIIVDDGSTDHTVTIMEDYRGKGINYLFKTHRGVSNARNAGIKISRGVYIAFLDSDDSWDENKLKITYQYTEKFPDIDIFHTDEVWYRRGKKVNQKKKHKRPEGNIYSDCLKLCCIGMSTSVVKATLFKDTGYFDESLPACEDYDLWLRACVDREVKLIPQALTIKDGGRDDQLSNQPGLDKYRIYSIEKMLKSGRLNSLQEQQSYEELVNKCTIYGKGAQRRGRSEEADFYYNKVKEYKI